MPNKKPQKRGFTLIELLIVITIIGILATFIVASFSSAQGKARDAKRKSDVDAIKKALELAKGDSSGGAFYPGCVTGTSCTLDTGGTNIAPNIVSSSYIKAVPLDPKGTSYSYNPGANGAGVATTYTLSICLENGAEATGVNVTSVTSTTCSSTRQYVVTNP